MTLLRALLAVLWLAFGLTAAAHTAPVKADPPCHMDMTQTHHDKAPKPVDAPMPCCSQPAVIDPAAPVTLTMRHITWLHLALEPARELTGRSLALEPHPPKAA